MISAQEVNADFDALYDQVNDNTAGISALEVQIDEIAFTHPVHREQVFLTSGTFTVPTGVDQVEVELIGGGGSGGGSRSLDDGCSSGGGGGQAGSYAKRRLDVNAGSSYAVTVGGGGTYDGSKLGAASQFGDLAAAAGGGAGADGGGGVANVSDYAGGAHCMALQAPGASSVFGSGGTKGINLDYPPPANSGAGGGGGQTGASGIVIVRWVEYR